MRFEALAPRQAAGAAVAFGVILLAGGIAHHVLPLFSEGIADTDASGWIATAAGGVMLGVGRVRWVGAEWEGSSRMFTETRRALLY